MANTNAQEAVLHEIAKIGLHGEVVIPPNTVTNIDQASNLIKILQAMSHAGVIKTNPPAPNRYE